MGWSLAKKNSKTRRKICLAQVNQEWPVPPGPKPPRSPPRNVARRPSAEAAPCRIPAGSLKVTPIVWASWPWTSTAMVIYNQPQWGRITNHIDCLVVDLPLWKIMEFVNGVRMTSHIWNGEPRMTSSSGPKATQVSSKKCCKATKRWSCSLSHPCRLPKGHPNSLGFMALDFNSNGNL